MKSSQYDKTIELAKKIDCLVDICNGRSKKQGYYIAYLTPENAISINPLEPKMLIVPLGYDQQNCFVPRSYVKTY